MTISLQSQRNHNGWTWLRQISALMLFVLCYAPWSPAGAVETALKKASLMPLWSPQAQFAGYYVALDKGIYARHGIDLKILKAGPGYSPAQTLQEGKADFAVLWLTTALKRHSAGVKLVNLAQIIQRSSMMLVAKKSSGIKTVKDMNGRKVGMWGGELSIPPRALVARYGIKVREVPQSHTINLFLRDGIDVTSAMWYNEYHVMLNAGLDPDELQVFSLHELGMQYPEDGIYTLEKTLQNDPALAKAFVAASLEGWHYAFAHPDEALDVVIKYMREAQIPANRVHQKWMLDRMRDLIMYDAPRGLPGLLKQQDYEGVGRALRANGLIRSYPDYATFSGRSNAREK
ncbi:ABC transporter substrate-binding protein [Trichlorobacter lovleyi]|uniref:Thiamine pyrimidine synthase n=1 Tax=Trichlorobacter lovleyi (strain ATCC BAA-1151 / DSM 17278 / SZ) TaxID=398767 RepID=B3E2T3_TRIL1|nr:ABC transporter substrate-binding protein [Trichlorobacter lovleyi]ACD95740.1 NMT1/THI5 like domain protein [Trichlorobacter lovleyi SZ]